MPFKERKSLPLSSVSFPLPLLIQHVQGMPVRHPREFRENSPSPKTGTESRPVVSDGRRGGGGGSDGCLPELENVGQRRWRRSVGWQSQDSQEEEREGGAAAFRTKPLLTNDRLRPSPSARARPRPAASRLARGDGQSDLVFMRRTPDMRGILSPLRLSQFCCSREERMHFAVGARE